MTKEQKFYKALQDVFIGAKIEGEGGFVNLMRIKSNYYRKIEDILKKDIEAALKSHPKFKDELFDKLYSFFSRYFTESGSIYFNSTPFHNNIYEKVYTDEKDVILFWKTQMLYYVKTDRIFRSLPVELDNSPSVKGWQAFPSNRGAGVFPDGVVKFYFDASKIESKKANEKRSLVFEFDKVKEDGTIVFGVQYSEKGTKTKQDELLKAIKRKGIAITEEQLERAFRVFEKQSEVDFFINKNAKAFLQEQFKLWSYQYFWGGAKEWGADRVNQLQILKDIAFKIIDFISQFEDELVKIWNKPKFVKNSNYVITLDRILNTPTPREGNNSPSVKGWQAFPSNRGAGVFPDGVVKWNELPFNDKLKERARELRKAGNLSEVLFWNQVKNKQFLGLDFDRQKIIGNYIVDFYCKNLGLVIEIDGESHDKKIEYDKERDGYLESLGLKVLHILDADIKKNLNGVMEFLRNEIQNTPPANSPLQKGWQTKSDGVFADTPLKEGNLVEKIKKHKNYPQQIKEWKELGIDKDNPKAPIDTKYFKDLELEILGLFEDLDKSLDGWLIKSENYQTLNTILPKFKERIRMFYIDPPYNTGNDGFMYSDKFFHSSWMQFIYDRLNLSKRVLRKDGIIFTSIGDLNPQEGESYKLQYIQSEIFDKRLGNLIWKKRGGIGSFSEKNMTENHEYITVFGNSDAFIYENIISEEKRKEYKEKDSGGFYRWMELIGPSQQTKEKRPNLDYGIIIDSKNNNIIGFEYNEKGIIRRELFSNQKNNFEIIKLSGKATWLISRDVLKKYYNQGLIKVFKGRDKFTVRIKKYLLNPDGTIDGHILKSLLLDNGIKVGMNNEGTKQLNDLFYPYDYSELRPKPSSLIKLLIQTTTYKGEIIGDFFAGSGTTGQAVMELNKNDNFRRKFILIEMADYFDNIILPRIKKISYSLNWKDGKPQYTDGNGIFFKYYELEQYEEALANCKYEDSDLFHSPLLKGWHSEGMTGYSKTPYQEYVFMKDEKMLKALEIDYEKEKVKVDLDKLYPNIDIAETLSNLTGKWIKKISDGEVEFEDGTKINTKDLDYKLIKQLIWWE